MRVSTASALSLFSTAVLAGQAAPYAGFNVLWSDTFQGEAGGAPDPSVWNIAQR